MLNARQRRRYSRTVDIWRPTASPTAATTYSRIGVNVPYGSLYTPNIDTPSNVGSFKAFSDLVLDGICLEASVTIADNDCLVDTTYLLDGSKSKLWGTGARLAGQPQLIETTIRGRDTNKQNFKAMSVDHLPPTVSANYT